MQVEITPLRKNGFKLSGKANQSHTQIHGNLTIGPRWVSSTQTRLAAELRCLGSVLQGDESLIAVIYEPQIKGWRGSGFNLTGWEIVDWKGDGRQIVMQEWACTIIGW